MSKYLILFFIILSGCQITEKPFYKAYERPPTKELVSSKIGILLRSKDVMELSGLITSDDIAIIKTGQFIRIDKYINADIEWAQQYFTKKAYDVVEVESAKELFYLIDTLKNRPIDKLIFIYSGEGSKEGLVPIRHIFGDVKLVSQENIVRPHKLLQSLGQLSGDKLLVINACHSGIFIKELDREDFSGSALVSCGPDEATTPCEPYGHSALIKTLKEKLENTGEIGTIETVGDTWTNFRHLWVQFWFGGKPEIGYDAKTYRLDKFKF